MATWREIRLFCKRNKLVLFCTYIAVTYIVLNVFVAEKNVSWLRFQKSDRDADEESAFDDLVLLNEKDIDELRGRGVSVKSVDRSNRRNNFKDLRFVKDFEGDVRDAKGEDDFNDGIVKEYGEMEEDSFYHGEIDWKESKNKDLLDGNDNDVENILPKNKFHEERSDNDVNEDELKREMLRGKLDRFKKLDEIVKEEKKEFGAYWDKVKKDKVDDIEENLDKNDDHVGDNNNDDDGGDGNGIEDQDKHNINHNDDDDDDNNNDNVDDVEEGENNEDKNDNEGNDGKNNDDGKEIDLGLDDVNEENGNDSNDDDDDDNKDEQQIMRDELFGGDNKVQERDNDDAADAADDNDDKINHDNDDNNKDEQQIMRDELLGEDNKVQEKDDDDAAADGADDDKNIETDSDKEEKGTKKHTKSDKTLKENDTVKSNEKNKKDEKHINTKNDDDDDDGDNKIDNDNDTPKKTATKDQKRPKQKQSKSHTKANSVLDIVMAQLEKDKLDTFEVDLSLVNKTVDDVKMPHHIEYGAEGDPGQNSTKYDFPEGFLTKELQKKREEDFTKNYFDLWVSNKIAVHRSLNDPRTDGCIKRQYNLTTYPSTSIIIVFYNEAWTTLLRTIHSVLDRTPKEALLEIILLDDFSGDSHLQDPLEVYIKPLKIIRLIRGTARLGLIKARNLGFLYAKGDIIVFLDSHIECFDGWLEPLVAPIVRDPKTVTFPIIDLIDKDSFGIQILPGNNVGTLHFQSMSFIWETSDKHDQWYYRSPTMPGGLYAISRKWFHYLGAYDPGLQLWGGENLEISFKIWMCGGTLLASACSHVGHVFRSKSPTRGAAMFKAVRTNTYRLAEVWLDRYKHLYYEKLNYQVGDFGNVTNQMALRKSLNCKSFDWFLSEINPSLKAIIGPEGNYSGLITNMGTGMCLEADFRLITVRKCDMMQPNQMWQLSPQGFLTNREYDMTVMEFTNKHRNTNVTTSLYTVKMRAMNRVDKDEKAFFSYDEKTMHLIHKRTQRCLDVEPASSHSVRISPCHKKAPIMKWELMTRKELQAYHKKKKVPIDWSV